MKRKFWIVWFFLFGACVPKDPNEVLSRVDERIYYPQQEGLGSLVCEVQSPNIEEIFRRIEEGKPESKLLLDQIKVKVRFYWKKEMGFRFMIMGIPKELPALQDAIWSIFRGKEVLLIPLTEQEQFKNFSVSLKKEGKDLVIRGINPKQDSGFQQYELVIKRWGWLIQERRFYGKGFVSYSRPVYQVWKGKRYLERIDTLQKVESGVDFRTEVSLEYQEVQGFWLVRRMVYQGVVVSTAEKLRGPIELILEDCQPNALIPVDLFNQKEVIFVPPESVP